MENVQEYFSQVTQTLGCVPQEPIGQTIERLRQARDDKATIFLFGNGGSGATASHIVNDLLKSTVRVNDDRPRLRVICLCDNTATMTAYANDVGYETVFAEPLASLADPGDVVIALSGSGQSRNVLRALERARELGLTRIGLTGKGGKMDAECEICIRVPSDSMQVIEDVHLIVLHSIFLALV
jgi:D-sedoheptulose 7-phosphate isomerase